MKHIATTTMPDGTTHTVNGFKKPTPTVAMQNRSIWMHSIDRQDNSNPIAGFAILIGTLVVMGLIVKFFG